MSGRFPGAPNIAKFWQNLCEGVESISFFSDQELLDAGVDESLLRNKDYVKAKGVLADADLFDAEFFGFSPREAEVMDPQYRLFLECAWESLEDAGYNPQTYEGLIGVYAGAARPSYIYNLLANPEIVNSVGPTQISISNATDFLTTQVSYRMNLRGPSMVIQSACSTSLVAVHVACQNVLSGECDIALAGGVAVNAAQTKGYLYREGSIASPDGHCRAFDAAAKGTVGGFGVGIVVLKRLEEALADGDQIHAIILGSAVNNDGSLKIGYAAPSVEGQALVIRDALTAAGVEEDTITYVEAHGTGTVLGDPIEVAALDQAYGVNGRGKRSCAVGSVKTNIGHLDAAAGVAGLIKTVLSLKHGFIPPSLHFKKPNSNIDFKNSRFFVNATPRKWEPASTPRRGAVSSFGIGGTNAHAILEEPPIQKSASRSRRSHLIMLSARSNAALDMCAANLADYLKRNPEVNLADVAYTLQVGRADFNHRRVLVTGEVTDLVRSLEAASAPAALTAVNEVTARPIAFMFSGQGSQYVQMGKGLYESERVFREEFDRCAEMLMQHGCDIRKVLFPDPERLQESSDQLNETSLTQPALFVVEYAMARLLMSWGIRPDAMIGHSLGEYVAATLAGTLTLEDALWLVARRGALMQQQSRGAMLSVVATPEQLRPYLGPKLDLAAINAPESCVISGSEEEIARTQSKLIEEGYACTRLNVSHAFHSGMMSGAVALFEEAVREIELKEPEIPFISNVTGTWITELQATDPAYWASHLRQTVRFADGISELMRNDDYLLLEVGPGLTFCNLAQRCLPDRGLTKALPAMQPAHRSKDDLTFLLETLGKMWLAGATIDWQGFYQDEKRCRVALPTYPFERQRYWIEPRQKKKPVEKLVKEDNVTNWFYVPVWKRSSLRSSIPVDHGNNKSSWLLFIDENKLSRELVQRLNETGQDVILVKPGKEYERNSERAFVIDPYAREDYSRLFNELARSEITPANVVHLWNAPGTKTPRKRDSWFASTFYRGFYSLLFIAQFLARDFPGVQVHLSVVANSVHDINGDEKLKPDGAMLLSPCKVIPQEYPNVICRFFDVADETPPADHDEIVEELLAHVDQQHADRVVAYRHQHRWVQVFERLPLEPSAAAIQLRERGVYLITGGLGRVGLSMAEFLAKNYAARLILVSRSGDASSARAEQLMKSADEFGSKIIIAKADVTNETEMRDVLVSANQAFGDIDGVIHCAGHSARKSIPELTPPECETIFAAKVQGLVTLRKVFRQQPPKFVALMSSLSTVIGGLGLIAYSAANLFMDGYAALWNGVDGTRWTSIGWDGWRFGEARSVNSGDLGIPQEQGVDAFKRIMNCRHLPVVAVSTGNLETRIRQWITFEFSPDKAQAPAERTELHQRPVLKSEYLAPANETENKIAVIWQGLLGIDRIGVEDNFFELGGHSLTAIQVMSRLREAFRIELPIRNIFEAPTISQLASVIAQQRVEQQDEQVAAMRVVPRHVATIEEILQNLDSLADVKAQV